MSDGMFTGIVEGTGTVTAIDATADADRLTVALPGVVDAVSAGQSVAVDGVCLTVEAYDAAAHAMTVFIATETADRTALGERAVGDAVNIERALAADGRLDGHIVQGHVDTTAPVRAVEQIGEDWTYQFGLPPSVAPYIVEKGSVAIDGISLTVAAREPDGFHVAVIPTTYTETTLSERTVGDAVNLEVDIIAKYVEQLTAAHR
ncbi:MAG: riboflavin synthase [Haloquadratum sp.]|nr:riboflavin synthase [Haloquadratum sp.]